MIKIGILCYPTYGGSGIVATELGMSLAHRGYQVHFISSSMPARLDITNPNIYFHKVNVEEYPLFKHQPYDIALSSTIYQVVKMYQLDIIHAHYAIPYTYAAYYTKQMLKDEGIDIKIVTTLHGTDITLVGQHPSYKNAVQFSINHSDAVTTVSESLKKDTYQFFDIKKEIHVIPNFIDNNLFNIEMPCWKDQIAAPHEKMLVHVSNLRKVKRVQDVLEVFKKVNQVVDTRLLLIGEGPEMERVNQFIEDNPALLNKIKLMGKVNELYPMLKCCDVFLLPSQQESFGLAALEAMAAGVPVVSSNAGGIPEVNINGVTGYTDPIGDTDAMAGHVLELVQNPDKLNKFKKNAKETAQKYDVTKILPVYEELYHQTLEKA